jgi:zinc D-Ala-D-Ala carboxypeptidase
MMQDMKLSPNFALHEFTRSQWAIRMGVDNTPDAQQIENLARLANQVLEPLRAALGGRVITIDSGYRCPQVNAAVGGAHNSAHLEGRAADILVAGMTPLQVGLFVQKFYAGASGHAVLDQCIYEGAWTHLAVAPPLTDARQEYLTARFQSGGVTYAPGILA